MIKKILLILFVSLLFCKLPPVNNSFELQAGIIRYSIKKLISYSIKKALGSAKNNIREYYKEKLLNYLHKHPEYKEYVILSIKKYIYKHPELKEKAFLLLQSISNRIKG